MSALETIIVTFYYMFKPETFINILKQLYDYVILYKEYTQSGLVHYHALAHQKKPGITDNILSLRTSVRRYYKKIEINPIRFTKYNFNIKPVGFIKGLEYVSKDDDLIYSNIPNSLINEQYKAYTRGLQRLWASGTQS